MQASSIAIITGAVMPDIRIMARIIVLHMSAQFEQAGAQSMGRPSIIWAEHTVHACSHAAHASMHACISAMSRSGMPSIDIISGVMASRIMASIRHPCSLDGAPGRRAPAAMVGPHALWRQGVQCPASVGWIG